MQKKNRTEAISSLKPLEDVIVKKAVVTEKKTETRAEPKKRGRKKEQLVGKTVGPWIVCKDNNDGTFICQHRFMSTLVRNVRRATLFAGRSYTKRADCYKMNKEYFETM